MTRAALRDVAEARTTRRDLLLPQLHGWADGQFDAAHEHGLE
jgi:hypothetical protein